MTMIRKRILLLLTAAAVILLSLGACTRKATFPAGSGKELPRVERSATFHERYSLERVVVLSRHNIRSPLSTNGSALAKLTPHEWFNWTSAPSELSLRGGVLETIMGQYFRKWLESEQLISENYIPKAGEIRFYANSMQRTIATAQYFSSGMLPVANVQIEHKYLPSRMDAVFTPQITHLDDTFEKTARTEIENMGGTGGLSALCKTLLPAYAVLEKTLDFEKSAYARENDFYHFLYDDTEIILKENNEPGMKGSLKTATSASDALVLQYYEEPDEKKAAFGHTLSERDWELIASIKDVYGDVLFTAPSVAKQAAGPLVSVIKEELTTRGRKFSFLCGHDSNIASVLAALKTETYDLPCAIEKKTPIGSKVVISVWKDKTGAEFADLTLVYQTVSQLRSCELLTLENPPAVYALSLTGLSKNTDALYPLSDVIQRCEEVME